MNKKQKLQELYNKLNSLQEKAASTAELENITDSLIQEEIANITAKVKDNPTIKTLQRFNLELARLKKGFDLQPVIASIKELQLGIEQNQNSLLEDFKGKLQDVKNSIPKLPEPLKAFDPSSIIKNIESLRSEFLAKEDFNPQFLKEELSNFKTQLQTIVENNIETDKKTIKEIEAKIAALRLEFLNRLASHGGGNMNRQVMFNGVDRLTKYTDINWKPGTNVSFTIANNNTTKQVDITINATGGSGSGITRVITNISGDTTADAAATTDYVYLSSGTLTLTLPTAVGNTNLYTIKNVGAGVVTIATTGGETIDGDSTVIMPVQFTSVDIISNTMAWAIT